MADKVQLRGDTRANWLKVNPILADREFVLETDTKQYKIGDGVSRYSALVYRGLPAVQQEGDSLTDVISQKVVTDALNEVRASHSEMFSETLLKQTIIDPMQGRYSSFSTPRSNNTVKFTGDLAPIGTDDFMIEFVGGFGNSNHNQFPPIKIGTGAAGSVGSIYCYNFTGNANRIDWLYFQTPSSNSINFIPAIQSPLGKPFHIIIGRSGVNAWMMIDGVKYAVSQSSVIVIANSVTISNASNFSLLRKFNFADEVFAKSLYNGGRWMEKTIGAEYRVSENKTLYTPPSWTLVNDSGGATVVRTQQPDGIILDITSVGTVANRPAIITPTISSNKYVLMTIELLSADTICPCPLVADGKTSVGNLEGQVNLTLGINILTYFTGTSGNYTIYFNGKYIYNVKVGALTLYNRSLQNEYLPSSLTPTVWRDTAGGSDLTATNPDKMTFSTAPLLQEKLWGSGAPTFTPDAIGQEYYDTTNSVKYSAFGTTNANDWKS